MKTYERTIIEHEGEWFHLNENWDYMSENCYPNNPEVRKEIWETFLKCAKNPEKYLASTDYMFAPKKIVNIGMYDGWPYWKPYPSFAIEGIFGAETHGWWQLNHVKEVKDEAHRG